MWKWFWDRRRRQQTGRWALCAAVIVATAAAAFFSVGSLRNGPEQASADTGFPATITTARWENGLLTLAGTGTFSACPNKDKAVGFAIFINGANPVNPGSGALDGVGVVNSMHPANMSNYVFPCQSPYTWGPDSHAVATPPSIACVVIYDVHEGDLPPKTGGHSTVGAGSNRNDDNSFEKNGDSYPSGACATPSVPTPTPAPSPTPPAPAVDMTVRKDDAPDPVQPGGTIAYTIVVTNHGPSTADNVVALDSLPANVTFVSATPSQGSCNFVSCNLGSMGAGTSAIISLTVRVSNSASGVLTNGVCVSTSTAETNLNNNCDTETTTVTPGPTPTPPPTPQPTPTPPGQTPTPTPAPGADLKLLKTDSPDPVSAGGTLTYGIAVTNLGPATARDVTVSDALPTGVTLVSATASQGSCVAASCNLGDIAPNQTVTIAFVVKVSADVSGTLSNIACTSTSTVDPNLSNNCDDENTTVQVPGAPTPLAATATPKLVGLPSTGGFFNDGSGGLRLILALGLLLLFIGAGAVYIARRKGISFGL